MLYTTHICAGTRPKCCGYGCNLLHTTVNLLKVFSYQSSNCCFSILLRYAPDYDLQVANHVALVIG